MIFMLGLLKKTYSGQGIERSEFVQFFSTFGFKRFSGAISSSIVMFRPYVVMDGLNRRFDVARGGQNWASDAFK